MPRYHFNVHDGVSLPDRDGVELPDLPAARKEAVRYAGALLMEQSERFWGGDEWHMEVTDDQALILFQLTFFASQAPCVTAAMPQ